jgi:hypothetical protein
MGTGRLYAVIRLLEAIRDMLAALAVEVSEFKSWSRFFADHPELAGE